MLTKTEHLKLRAVDVLTERIERRILPVGDILPDADVTTFGGQTLPIRSFYNDKPLLLVFLRASWWPYCRAQVTMLNGMASTFVDMGCTIVAVTRETVEECTFERNDNVTLITDATNEFGHKLNLAYKATDEMKKIYGELGIEEELEGYYDTSELDVPMTLIVDTTGRMLYKYAKRDYTKRAPGSEIIRELTRISNNPCKGYPDCGQ